MLAALLLLTAGGSVLAEEGPRDAYMRLGFAAAVSNDMRFADVDCGGSDPAAYFGCGNGPDGRPIGAYGDFGTQTGVQVAVGHRLQEGLRGEIELGYLPNAEFDGLSNFAGVEIGTAPVAMKMDSLTLMATAYIDLLPALGHEPGRLQPFVSAGLGVSRNRVGKATFAFPTLGEGDATIVPSGTRAGFAWSLGAGVGVVVTDDVTVDFTYRFVDRGKVGSDAGPIRIIREGKADLYIPVGPTWADFGTHELGVSLRHRF